MELLDGKVAIVTGAGRGSGQRIQLVQGHRPAAEIEAGDESWTVDRIEARRGSLLGTAGSWIPPFLPPVS